MRRVVVVGAGFFGGHVARRLRAVGIAPLVATRSGADLRIDAEDDTSLRATLRPGDVVVDTAGPFANRSTRLVRAAMRLGCDVIDLAESLPWSEAVLALRGDIAAAGIRVFPACSAIAAVSGACVIASGIGGPERVDQYLAPASAETASPATVRAFTASLGTAIRTLRDGHLVTGRGYADSSPFPASRRRGGRVESAAAVLLPASWPAIRGTDFWVDPNVPFARGALALASRAAPLAALARAVAPRVRTSAVGRRDGVFAVRVRGAGQDVSFTLSAPRASYLIAVEPSVMVAEALARGAAPPAGVVLPHAQLDPDVLFARLRALGISVARSGPTPRAAPR